MASFSHWMIIGALLLGAAAARGGDCESLRSLGLDNVEIVSARTVAAGPYDATGTGGQPPENLTLPAHCRVAGILRPTPQSHIRFELWMPTTHWNGRFEGVGNGNYAGMLSIEALPHGVLRGSAIATTDTGHESTPADPQTIVWARQPEKLVDFGHRAIHEMTRAGKQLVLRFYGRPARRSYFVSCSNGGRQGLMSAQRYPSDYDGIVAGAPVRSWTRLNTTFMFHHRRFVAQPHSRLSESQVTLLQRAVLDACDAADGIFDGIVDDPRECRFDAARLQCTSQATDDCLTADQIETVRLLRAGVSAPRTARLAGLPPGTESEHWSTWIMGRPPMKSGYEYLGVPFFRDMLHGDENWKPERFDLKHDSILAHRKLAPTLDANNPDLRRYFARGGKLILYTGWLDPAIPALDTIEYYEQVRQRVGAVTADKGARLFVVPGMAHCGDGPGYTAFGQWYNGTGNPAEDVRAAIIEWVEQDRAPAEIIAARSADSFWLDPRTMLKTGEALPTRRLCAFPQRARWTGRGSTNDAANFQCTAPEKRP